ncbi:MAG: dTMP kinase [Chloroflexi bacterium HGW-Chloroflexi-2]|jgi:dTMP kinase|nr:MAG: dTMP kinase [Chloroflexi bacterium HGW-Chloroflexi-2]
MFITLEGPEGSGKSSQLPILADWLREQGYNVYTTREPGGTLISDQIRTILHDLENTAMHPRTEILLYLASRSQHVEEVIRPLLEKDTIVLCDRYADSTLAYQGYGHGVDIPTLKKLLDFSTGGLYPDLTILLDLNVEIGLERRKQSGGEWNRLDAYALAFHKRVREGYLTLVADEPQRWRIVDAAQSFDDVQKALREVIRAELSKN